MASDLAARQGGRAAWLGVWLVGLGACRAVAPGETAAGSAKERWREIAAAEGSLPAGDSLRDRAFELASFASSPDPVLRDEIGFEVSARWIGAGRLSVRDLRDLMEHHLGNLTTGLGESTGDGVFLRSFSALHLSVLIARDRAQPFLDERDVRRLVAGVARLLSEERDRRGWVEGQGWAHSIAHGADAAKFLARHPLLDAAGAVSLFAALEAGFEGPNAWGENDRLAAAAQSLCLREEFDAQRFDSRCAAWIEESATVWRTDPFDTRLFRRSENQKQFLRALHARIRAAEQPGERAEWLARRSLETLAAMR